MKPSKLISLAFLFSGLFFLLQILLPVAKFKIWENIQTENSKLPLISPLEAQVLGVSVQQVADNFPACISTAKRESIPFYSSFEISIPKLQIEQAKVEVDSNDLTLGLAHLPGSALPGEKGNVFISGHSILPFFKKGDKAVFAKLPDIKEEDMIKVYVAGMQFNYKVISIKIVNPKDLSVIKSPDQLGRYLTLMTCVPPGLNTKRLIVLAKLI